MKRGRVDDRVGHAFPAASPAQQPPARWIAWLVVVVWLAGTALAFMWFRERGIQADAAAGSRLRVWDPPVVAAEQWFEANRLRLAGVPGAPGTATWIHVSQPGCVCNEAAHLHVLRIRERFEARGVRFIALEALEGPPATVPGWLAAMPAALVYDANGKLAYAGPYSDSAWCGTEAGFVEAVLEGLLQGRSPQPQSIYARGCSCGLTSHTVEDRPS
ncbi:MAG: hypothetical protein RL026_679 [Pseudomonadota bacterium]|jgi:hypothetical protein